MAYDHDEVLVDAVSVGGGRIYMGELVPLKTIW